MKIWEITTVNTNNGAVKIGKIKIQSEIYQDDLQFTFLLCLARFTLTTEKIKQKN